MKLFRLYDVQMDITRKYDWVDIEAESEEEAVDAFVDIGLEACCDSCFNRESVSFNNEWGTVEQVDINGNPIEEPK
jgi:hypothetical protein